MTSTRKVPRSRELEPHQIYVLRLMAQPAEIQINEYEWDDDLVAVGVLSFWSTAFTGLYLGQGEALLPGFDDDIVQMEELRLSVVGERDESFWSNTSYAQDPFWKGLRQMARRALEARGVALEKPDPEGWYLVLPEELH